MPQPGASLLSYPAAIPLSNHTLVRLADLLREQRNQRRCRWRRLPPEAFATTDGTHFILKLQVVGPAAGAGAARG